MQGEVKLKNNCPPYMFANCYYGMNHRNNKIQMEFTWITRSLAWYGYVRIKRYKAFYEDKTPGQILVQISPVDVYDKIDILKKGRVMLMLIVENLEEAVAFIRKNSRI